MKKNILISIFSIISLLVISSCGDNGTNPSSNNEIWPLNFNNYWKFDVYDYDTLGNITSQSVITYKIEATMIINNETMYIMDINFSDAQKATGYFTKRVDGVYSHYGTNIILSYKYPATLGEKFNSFEGIKTVESTNYKYNTSIGSFSCYQYTKSSDNSMESQYFKPGVGFVAYESYKSTVSGRLFLSKKSVLKEYKVN